MKQIILYITLIFTSLFSIEQTQGQSKDFLKLNKIYSSGNYDKVIRKAEKLQTNSKSRSLAHYYTSLSYFQKFISGDSKIYFNKSLKSLKRAKKYDESLSLWVLLSEDINLIKSELNTQTVALSLTHKIKARNLCKNYIDLFGDTLDCYTILFKENNFDPAVIDNFDNHALLESNDKRDSIKALGLNLVGTPYKWAGETPAGFDCSGFVMYVYQKAGIKLPHNANKISYIGKEVTEDQAQVGDVILFGSRDGDKHRAYHAGIIYDNTDGEIKVIHCISKGVHISDNYNDYWKSRVMLITNIIDNEVITGLSQK